MGMYYKIFASLAVLIFVVMFAVVGIGTVVSGKRARREAAEIEQTTVTVRYFMSEEDTSRVAFLRVTEGQYYTIEEMPYCASNSSRTFLGLCDAAGTMVVDANGNSLSPADRNMLLYPRFE